MTDQDTKKIIDNLLSKDESQTFECKRAKKKPSEVLPSICALANADGGLFVYGLSDPEKGSGSGRLIGISEAEDHADELVRLIGKEFDPPIQDISHRYLDITNVEGNPDRLLLFILNPSTEVHSIRSGPTYVRRGRQNVLLTHRQSLQLQYEKGAISYESELCPSVSMDDLDQDLLKAFLRYNDSEADPIKFFLKNGLAEEKNGKATLNNSAILLFGINPAVILKRKASISIVHYFGTKSIPSEKPNFVRPPFTIEGPLITQIRKTFQYVSENAVPVRLKGATFRRLKIPQHAIQESITNAVIHRDYSISNHIQIRIFDDRIEVESPGWFPGLVSPDTILDDRCARNPIIERILRKMPEPPNLDIGEGVNRMYREMKRHNLYLPLYLSREYSPHAVRVVLFNEERTDHWDTVQNYLGQKGRVTNKEFCSITELDTLKASDLLKKWVTQGLLEKRGASKRGTYYQKPGYKPKQTSFLEGLF